MLRERVTALAAFELDNVTYRYPDGRLAVCDVSLRVEPGEKVVLLGANGCGKSTLLRIMNGLLAPTEGRLRAYGQDISEQTLRDERVAFSFRRRVGFVFQNSDAQLFSPTVREEIAFGPLQMGLEREEVLGRIRDVAALLGIGGLLDRPPYQLSGGEKKKVAIASVLVTNPDAILLDEPTNGLDPRSQRWLVETLVALHAAGKTLVTTTHDLDIVPEISSRALVMDEGHTLHAQGTPREMLENTAMLLRVNLIHEHTHWHGNVRHSHAHAHSGEHAHTHEEPHGE